eukprot:CAMPEP_0172730500 /NCGR_PEP_ID=MMETSP1074-20121228/98283_1 /TAXON_ID=2916 /ORGANISM="Ceratium fusus, Strain PA161109" /LENGTH=64 /DNA_ID=CAMNT_0013558249 /DNA_START=191 /DNA_END=381 /DNA_ORIENTATION=-
MSWYSLCNLYLLSTVSCTPMPSGSVTGLGSSTLEPCESLAASKAVAKYAVVQRSSACRVGNIAG